MKNNIKLLVLVLTVLLILTVYWNFSSTKETITDTKSNIYENLEKNSEENKVTEKITLEETSIKKIATVNYKDIFKEPKEIQTTVEEIVEREELATIDSEVKELILEADELINKENLHISNQKIDENHLEKYNYALENLEKKLDKLETE